MIRGHEARNRIILFYYVLCVPMIVSVAIILFPVYCHQPSAEHFNLNAIWLRGDYAKLNITACNSDQPRGKGAPEYGVPIFYYQYLRRYE